MTKQRLTSVVACLIAASSLFAAACTDNSPTGLSPGQTHPSVTQPVNVQAAHGRGLVLAPRGRRGFDGSPTSSPTGAMTPHNNSILTHTNTYAIFVGPSWNTDPTFTTDKVTAVGAFFQGFGGSNYANIVTEYGPSNQSVFRGSFIDNSTPPNGADANAVGGYVCSFLGPHGISPDVYAVYTVYTSDAPPPDSGYVGYHFQTTCSGVSIHIAIVFNVDGLGYVTDPLLYHSDNAAALVDITAHELEESITDPNVGSGWFAQNTQGEISDKCNFSFGPSPYVTLSNGVVFKLQGQWSNHAFQTSTGFANYNAELGCINSAPPPPSAQVTGATYVAFFAYCNWSVSVTAGASPFSYSWSVVTWSNGQQVGSWVPPVGSDQNFTSQFYSSNTFTTGQVSVVVTDAWGRSVSAAKSLTYSPGSSCS